MVDWRLPVTAEALRGGSTLLERTPKGVFCYQDFLSAGPLPPAFRNIFLKR